MPRGGLAFLSGAHAIPVQRKLMNLSQADCLARRFSFSRRAAAVPQFRACVPLWVPGLAEKFGGVGIRVIAEVLAAIG
jgi:hypothetical protein